MSWDLVVLVFLLYMCITYPVLVCFDVVPATKNWLWYTELTTTILFSVDIIMNFNTAIYGEAHTFPSCSADLLLVHRQGLEGRDETVATHYVFCCPAKPTDEDNKLVYNRWRIARAYATSWLVIDILAVMPFEYMATLGDESYMEALEIVKVCSNSPPWSIFLCSSSLLTGNRVSVPQSLRLAKLMRILRFLRMAKLLKIFKILKMPEIINRILSVSGPAVIRVIIVIGCAFFLLHFMACGFYFAAQIYHHDTVIQMYLENPAFLNGTMSTEQEEQILLAAWEHTWVGSVNLVKSDHVTR